MQYLKKNILKGCSLLSPSHVTGNVDLFIRFERARRDEHNGISHLRIRCQIKKLEGAESAPPPVRSRDQN